MNALVKTEPKLMLLDYMADKYALKPDEFGKTVRATCGLSTATPEQVAAFLIVAKEYDLNPLTKEIYAFPGKGGGVVPIVSIDGWVNLVNSNPQCDGFQFEMEHTPDGKLVSCTCTMFRKDRAHPVSVTEYLSECKRPTDPWKMEHRMLRHKAMIQAARYAFGFAGIYDEDEGRTIADSDGSIVAPRDTAPPRSIKTIEHQPSEQADAAPAMSELVVEHEHVPNEAVPEPHELVPVAGKTNSFEGWGSAYIELIETSPDTATAFKWVDLNQARLKKLEGSPEWTAKVKKTTAALIERLRGPEKPAEQPSMDMGSDAPAPAKPASKPRKNARAPDFAKDYDAWLTYWVDKIAHALSPEEIETIWDEQIDPRWPDITFPGDKESLLGARRDAEGKMEQ